MITTERREGAVAPDRKGVPAEITPARHREIEAKPNYFGVTVGRYANRIAGGRFSLDGRAFQLPQNNNGNSLHGGAEGFDKRNWRILSVSSGPIARVVMGLTSADGDQGYPGKVEVTVTYSLDDAGDLTIAFDAASDKPTIVNMTNHALFNMAGDGAPEGTSRHMLTIPAQAYTPVNETPDPDRRTRPVAGRCSTSAGRGLVALGLRDGRDPQIVDRSRLRPQLALDKGQWPTPQLAARLEEIPVSGRVLEVLSTEPGIQFYTGNFLDVRSRTQRPDLPDGRRHRARTAEVSRRAQPGGLRNRPRRSREALPPLMIYRLSTSPDPAAAAGQ